MDARALRFWKIVALVNGLLPLGVLLVRGLVIPGGLGANPVRAALDATGTLALIFLLITLTVTPARKLSGLQQLGKLRRMFGLLCFLYAALHFLTYAVLDQALDLRFLAGDALERPFIALGFLAFFFLIPLAATSTNGMIRRLGGARWQRLHRRIYAIAVLAIAHQMLAAKADRTGPVVYALVLLGLLLSRLWLRKKE
jgi:sulfoxide reductase heme-binding subunit YedZ